VVVAEYGSQGQGQRRADQIMAQGAGGADADFVERRLYGSQDGSAESISVPSRSKMTLRGFMRVSGLGVTGRFAHGLFEREIQLQAEFGACLRDGRHVPVAEVLRGWAVRDADRLAGRKRVADQVCQLAYGDGSVRAYVVGLAGVASFKQGGQPGGQVTLIHVGTYRRAVATDSDLRRHERACRGGLCIFCLSHCAPN